MSTNTFIRLSNTRNPTNMFIPTDTIIWFSNIFPPICLFKPTCLFKTLHTVCGNFYIEISYTIPNFGYVIRPWGAQNFSFGTFQSWCGHPRKSKKFTFLASSWSFEIKILKTSVEALYLNAKLTLWGGICISASPARIYNDGI